MAAAAALVTLLQLRLRLRPRQRQLLHSRMRGPGAALSSGTSCALTTRFTLVGAGHAVVAWAIGWLQHLSRIAAGLDAGGTAFMHSTSFCLQLCVCVLLTIVLRSMSCN